MADKTIRIRVPIDSQEPQAWQAAWSYADAIAQRSDPPGEDVILLTHTKQQLAILARGSMTAATFKALNGGKSVPLPSGATLRAETLRPLRFPPRGAVIIAYFGEDKMMTTVDGYAGVTGVVVVPDHEDSIPEWVARWNPRVPGQPAQPATVLIADPKVEKAMEVLTGLINRGNGVLNPRDKQTADDILRILRAKGHSTDTAKLKSWAIQHGWPPKAADELATLAGRIFALKTKPSLAKIHDPDGRYARWI